MKKLLNKKGFTLIELMVVIVIVGILAAVAIPKFTHASHKAKCSEIPTNLMGAFTAAGTFFQEKNSYDGATFDAIGLDDPSVASRWFSYAITTASASNFTASAIVEGSGFGNLNGNETATIDQDQIKDQHDNFASYLLNWKTP